MNPKTKKTAVPIVKTSQISVSKKIDDICSIIRTNELPVKAAIQLPKFTKGIPTNVKPAMEPQFTAESQNPNPLNYLRRKEAWRIKQPGRA